MSAQSVVWGAGLIAALVLSPLLFGIINRVKAFFAGRRGPKLLQLYYDLAKLLRKSEVRSATSGGVLPLAPVLSLAALGAAALLLPYGFAASPLGFRGDALLFFYLLGTARLATVYAALDTGSSFEGMGASREMQFSALAEAAIFGVLGFLALLVPDGVYAGLLNGAGNAAAASGPLAHLTSVLLAAVAFFLILLAENCRVPADDPETHLELTMIHEAMILDYSGPDLAVILYGSALKLWLFCTVFVSLLIPVRPTNALCAAAVYLGGVLLTAALIGAVESCMARYRFHKVPQMLVGALAAALLGIFFLTVFEGGLGQ